MHNVAALAQELKTLRAAIAVHQAQIDEAWEARDAAFEFCNYPKERDCSFKYDMSQLQKYPAVAAAERLYEELRNDSAFYWAESRVRDIELVLGLGFTPQTPLFAHYYLVPVHASVAAWVRNQTTCRCAA